MDVGVSPIRGFSLECLFGRGSWLNRERFRLRNNWRRFRFTPQVCPLFKARLPESINFLDVEMPDSGFTADERTCETIIAESQPDFAGWKSTERLGFRYSEYFSQFAVLYFSHGFVWLNCFPYNISQRVSPIA